MCKIVECFGNIDGFCLVLGFCLEPEKKRESDRKFFESLGLKQQESLQVLEYELEDIKKRAARINSQPVLKTVNPYFSDIWHHRKRSELRKDDRGGYKIGDVLLLREYDADRDEYLDREMLAKVTYVLKDFPGLVDGYIILQLRIIEQTILEKTGDDSGQ